MGKLAVITDSIASLPPDAVSRFGLRILPINISFNGKQYRDGVDLTAAEAYRMLKQNSDQFLSSPSSIGEYLNIFREVARQAEGIICITLSSKLSGMYNVALLATARAREESINIPIEVVNSMNATVGEGLVVTAAAEAAASGKSLSEVAQIARTVSARVGVIGILETIRYVYRTGRIPKLTAKYGSLLNIRPVFVISGGAVHTIGIIKDRETGINSILKRMRKNIRERPVHVAIAHADAFEAGQKLKERIQTEFNCVEVWLADFSPVMAYATGTGVIVAAYYVEDRKVSAAEPTLFHPAI